ncbi:MAG: bifunctional 2-C-methyl-D-erythritol 4-phosphate cytidylyltransferase/2-C-methyl-D-erythritol 2,4-cyclodiphosphate synthase [Pikeienuella sp.]
MTTAALIVAAGKGIRAGGALPKQYQPVGGQMVLTRTIRAILASSLIDEVRVCIHPDHLAFYREATRGIHDARLGQPVLGGAERALTVVAGLEALQKPDLVLIHDGARPFVTAEIIADVIASLSDHDGAIAALEVVDALRRTTDGICHETIPRGNLWRAQTPQGFHFDAILAAHRANRNPLAGDDAEVAHTAGLKVAMVPAAAENFKITTPGDFARAERQVKRMTEFRTGQGFDVHAFAPLGPDDKGVILCGVTLPHDQRLSGHSDADVAMHALTDAVFGAIAEGDIGQWFPPNDMQWKGAASHIFLEKAVERVAARGGRIVNCDVTIICELPKIGPHAGAMREALADIMKIDVDRISVKATTSERLGFTGRGEGIAAMATATVAL